MSNVKNVAIDQFARPAYLAYAMKTVLDRAIPDVEDGMKPVQRRILYTMHQLKLLPQNAKPVKSARVVGDCFVAGTPVHTAEGLKSIEQVSVGEYVRLPNGSTSKVVEAFRNPPSDNLRVGLSSGYSLDVTPGQLFRVLEDDLSIGWARADALEGRLVLVSSPNALGFAPPHPSTQRTRAAYAMGLLVAEDCLTDQCRSRVDERMTDNEPLLALAQVCEDRGAVARWSTHSPTQPPRLEQIERQFSELDDAFGVCQDTCAYKQVPAWVLSDRSLFAPFMAGFMDGDGCVCASAARREVVLTTTSELLSNQLGAMLMDCGIHSHKMAVSSDDCPAHTLPLFQVIATGVDATLFAAGVASHVQIPSKKEALSALAVFAGRDLDTRSARIPSRLIWEELSSCHLGAGWYLDKDGQKFRQDIRDPSGSKASGSKVRASDIQEGDMSYQQLKKWGILAKLERLGSPLVDRINALFSDYCLMSVVSVESAGRAETFDIQIEHDSHEFLANGCAVHNCIGKYHPHGDSAVYEAMVRMAQPFAMRYPLVHGEGNFGSRDGDSPAAMRYTEARLAPIAASLLDELQWDTVDFQPNYDNVLQEPTLLPARLPFALLNGTTGIAVGMQTNTVSHNLREVVDAVKLVLTQKKTTIDEIMDVLPGPDFATGAQIISPKEDIKKAYAEGKGAIRVRARWHIEHMGKNNKDWQMVITQLPPDTNTSKVMEAIEELINPTPPEKKGKKQPLTAEQLRLKKLFSELIDEVQDGRDKDHPLHIVITPPNRNVDPELLANSLCTYTPLESNVNPNFVFVDDQGNPRRSGILDWLQQWCAYRITTVRRRLTDEKERIDRRLHILAGRISILDRIEEVIKVLKSSQDPKLDLMNTFKLDDIQAEDVLEMRLRQLANLEKTKILDEQAQKLAEQARLIKLLGDEKLIRKMIVKELDDDAKSFGDDRRTLLEVSASSASRKQAVAATSTVLGPDPIAVALTERGWIAWRPAKSLEEAQSLDYKIKAGDSIKRIYFGDRAHHLLLVSTKGRGYSLRLTDLPSKADTAPLTQFFDIEHTDKFAEASIAQPHDKLIVAGSNGNGFVVEANAWINRMKAGKVFLTLEDDEAPLPPLPLAGYPLEGSSVVALSSDGRAVAFALSELKELPKGKGVGLIGLAPKCVLSDVAVHHPNHPAVLVLPKAKVYALPQAEIDGMMGPRSSAKKGKALHKQSSNTVFVRPGREAWVAPESS